MRIVDEFPRAIRDIENVWIPMSDGCRLAARIWMPEDAREHPVPAIVEYIPYRKRDGTRERDEPMHRYFAGHGYAAVRIDLRGSGESDGILYDEYTEQEQRDGVEAIRWIAGQPWCSGAVGMMGKSWGGFNSLQVAALAPPELEAVISVCAADDRYADDAHYMGGCLLNENLIWGSVLFTLNAQPPDPIVVGPRWRDMWLERLGETRPFPEVWLRHQRRDEYWKHGSVCEDFGRIRCPVYTVGGWADGYTNAVARLLSGLRVPRKGLIGPWAHVYPHEGVPRPAIGFLQEALLWWDRWLKGVDTGVMDEPMLRVWMQESVPPRTFYEERPGRWVAEERWPSERIRSRRLSLNAAGLGEDPTETVEVELRSLQTVGLAAGSWCGFGVEGELPPDQREDDGKSLVFDGEPLAERLEILGTPEVTLELALDRPIGFVAVRLNDVAPDGASSRVTYGLLNLTHRGGHERPEPLEADRWYRIRVRLNDVAHSFAPGHRLRVAVSTSYWPVVWPAPESSTLLVRTGAASFLDLPVRPPRDEDRRLRAFGPPEGASPLRQTDLHPGGVRRTIHRDPVTGEVVYRTETDLDDEGGPALTRVEEIELETGHGIVEEFRIREGDPLSARAEITQKTLYRRGAWSARVETHVRLSSTRKTFRLEADVEAFEGNERVFRRSWDEEIARDFV